MTWLEKLIDSIYTWDARTELPLGVYDYLDAKQSEQDYYWESDYEN